MGPVQAHVCKLVFQMKETGTTGIIEVLEDEGHFEGNAG